ncbi:MAG: radical SAM protein [Betaproteobacteria bacterium]|nr:radical SAM protein [Betaproteobacteria bacterium]
MAPTVKQLVSWIKGHDAARPFEAFQVEVTSRCNLKCVMCPVTVLADRWPARDMSWETFGRIALAFERAKCVHLQGWGEPLLHRRVFDMIARAKSAGCRVGFTTNGTRLTRANGTRLLDLGLDLLAVSIAGASAATHEAIRVGSDFARLVENLRRFLRLRRERGYTRPKVQVFYLMTSANFAELPRAVELAADLGADELVATNLDYVITAKLDELRAYSSSPPAPAYADALEQAHRVARRTGIAFRPHRLQFTEMAVCDLNPLRILFVSADGEVSPCVYSSPLVRSEIPRVFEGRPVEVPVVSFGNVNDRSLMKIWEGAAYREFRQRFSRRIAGVSAMMFGAARAVAPVEESPEPDACRSCAKRYGV